MAKNSLLSFLDLRYPKTRIMATIGPSNCTAQHLSDMLDAGASIFRFNAAHIIEEAFDFQRGLKVAQVLDDIRHLSEERRQPIVTFLDLAGPKVRVQRLLSVHRRWNDAPSEKLMPNHPCRGDTVYLYAKDVAWHDEQIRRTLGTADPSVEHNFEGLTGQQHVAAVARDVAAVSVDHIWRIHTDIASFDTVREHISLKDGMCTLTISQNASDFAKCTVEEVAEHFLFLPGQGVNPKGYIFPQILTDRDVQNFHWALDHGIDAISMSFACSPLEAFYLKKLAREGTQHSNVLRQAPFIFAKFETTFAVSPSEAERFASVERLWDENVYGDRVASEDWERYLRVLNVYEKRPVEALCEAFDGAMVARGDLAVEADKYRVPFYQQEIIAACRLRYKPVIVATEVLQAMKDGNPATRAEIGDVATAVLQGADVIMLSGEVASTKSDPARVVAELQKAISAAEQQYLLGDKEKDLQRPLKEFEQQVEASGVPSLRAQGRVKVGMGSQVCIAARARKASAIIASVTTGETALSIAYFRPAQQIIAIASDLHVAKRLVLARGVYPVVMQYPVKHELNDFIQAAREIHAAMHIEPWETEGDVFIVPGLLRIDPQVSPVESPPLVPNTVHEFYLSTSAAQLPEREKKYVLSPEHYQRLRNYVRQNAHWVAVAVEQSNFYFDDPHHVVSSNRAMVRMRCEQRDGKERVLLTFKGEGRFVGRGTVEREENEFDLTSYCVVNGGHIAWERLPRYHKRFLWERFQTQFAEVGIHGPEELALTQIAHMRNSRLSVEVPCGLTLELDAFVTPQRSCYELEVETLGVDEDKRDDFIHPLFALLDIPLAYQENYPSKYVIALVDSGKLALHHPWREAMEQVEATLRMTHRQSCTQCCGSITP